VCDSALLRCRDDLELCRIELNAARRQIDELRLQGVSVSYADFLEFQQVQSCADEGIEATRPRGHEKVSSRQNPYAMPLMVPPGSASAACDPTRRASELHRYAMVTHLGTLIDVLG
jgi:hypothetical protein